MQWKKIFEVFLNKKTEYFIWLLANLGGILIAYFACFTIWLFHRRLSTYMPGYEVFLITGTISLAVTGVSYIRLKLEIKTTELSPVLAMSWPFLLMIVYGILITVGVTTPIISIKKIWLISVIIFLSLIAWSSLMWLHEQGLREDLKKGEPEQPMEPEQLVKTAENLPKV